MAEKHSMHILFAGAEAVPLAKVGGLGDVAGALPQAIKDLAPDQVDIRLILPYHAAIKQKNPPVKKIGSFAIASSSGPSSCDLYVSQLGDLPLYLLDNEYINHNSPVYYGDAVLDGRKYAYFSVALLEAMKFLNWQVDLLHSNDWHTALAIYALKTLYAEDPFFANTKTVLSVHNLPYNGYGADSAMTDLGFPPYAGTDLPDWASLTPLPLGLASADQIIAVSPGYAQEILTPEFGCGLDEFLEQQKVKLTGISNGIDTQSWDPATNPFIAHNFSAENLIGKAQNKADLQKEYGLDQNPDIPLITIVSRLDYQKGLGLIFDGLQEIIKKPWQFVLLGTGASDLEVKARDLADLYPKKIASILKYDNAIAHKLYASGDIFLMPSLYEPCGLSQMFAMRYGNIPVARATGGLKDSIIDFTDSPEKATGFLFSQRDVAGMLSSLNLAFQKFANKSVWNEIQQNAMRQDFSWSRSAQKYLDIYQRLLSADLP